MEMSSGTRVVELHVEELVLHGFSSGDRDGITEALQVELQRLLAGQAPRLSVVSRPRINGGTIRLRPGSGAVAIGRRLAGAIHGAIIR
jgi:hypothetical protein